MRTDYGVFAGIYVDQLVDNFPSPVKHYDQVEEAVVALRRTLQSAEVKSKHLVLNSLNPLRTGQFSGDGLTRLPDQPRRPPPLPARRRE